ncbi:succinate dehydrogenase / fumarate reductase membrane anchor subunit [Mesorhizobium sp. J18]|uniref:succinate dehydrogenase, hydrophobic membrane anchor protein n=1 Tax=Mesorhizobium sp. J18 TaxID=935263 RepID=UPI00119AA94B|nr:succinate dehydrogenase, hydrophobic membrane anchor protein [Mesorhizobium sp. J18]TWG92573.1 succinate dehydrogenase / fumarate reductase membrane anchor subunit [Mesorhizobium sp. J18]
MAQMQTPLRKVRGLGSAKDGTAHFWRVRVTSVALVPLSLFAIGLVVSLIDAGYAETRAVLAQPIVALLLGLFVVISLDHMRSGMEEIIQDYVHGELAKVVLLMLNLFFIIILGAASIFALLKIAFGG